jgi:hypothetical protein
MIRREFLDYWVGGFERLFQSKPFVDDAVAIADIEPAKFELAMDRVEAQEGFLSGAQLRKVIADVLDERQAKALVNFLINLRQLKSAGSGKDDNFLETTKKLIAAAKPAELNEKRMARVLDRLPRILKQNPAIDLQAKAEGLAIRTGSTVDDISLVCDLRPVFDEKRERVEGMIPLTTLLLSVTRNDGESLVLESILTELEVARLCEEADRARKKLLTLKKLLAEKNIPVPESRMTTSGEIKQ